MVEGDTYTHTGFFSDPDSTSWTGTVNYGDGTGDEPLVINPDNTFELNHLYKDNGNNVITVTITDTQGTVSYKTASVTVTNAAPIAGIVTASINPIQVNTSTTATVPFSDLGVLDTHTVVISWGDGQTTTCPPNSAECTITASNGSGSVSGTHTYQATGVYEITISITDNDGAADSVPYQYISVYNPTNQGLFSGARLFTSQQGSYPANQALNGQVQFGITAKYQNGSPNGKVSMKFNAANFEFDSTGINVLVISTNNGVSNATLKGTGTINGQGNYAFLVTGADGGPGGNDVVRFRITDPANNNAVIYDSQFGTTEVTAPNTLVTGQIIIH